MKHEIRQQAIRIIADDAELGISIAQKIVNHCEGVLVATCLPYSWLTNSVVVYIETSDNRKFEKVFNKKGTFLYNRKAK